MMSSSSTSFWCLVVCIWLRFVISVLGDCRFPNIQLDNGRVYYQENGDENLTMAPENYLLKFRCYPGYQRVGAKMIICKSSRWTSRVPSCIKLECPNPPSIAHGKYKLNMGVHQVPTILSKAIYSCDIGYQLEKANVSSLTCELESNENVVNWKGEIPHCIKRGTCSDPGISPDGQRGGNCCFTGDIVTFSCKDGFELVGEENLECLDKGFWSSYRPLCRPLGDYCEHPPLIPFGAVKGEKDGDYYLPYEEVEVLCEPGYKYSDPSEFIMCEEGGTWEADFKACVEAFCDPPAPLANGTIIGIESKNITAFPFNFELTYICDKGFRLIGDSWRHCDRNGWSGDTPRCEVVKCPDPGVPEHGTRQGESFEVDEKVIFKCFSGYELLGSFERYCLSNGQWSGELASCNVENNYCPDPGIPINGMKNTSDYDMGVRIGFRCHPGFTLLGSAVRECLPNRTWSGKEAKCLGPYDFDNTAEVIEILKAAVAEKVTEQRKKLQQYRIAQSYNGTGPMGRRLDLNFPGRLILYFVFDVSGSVREHNFRTSVDFAKALVKKIGISENGARAGAVTFSSKADIQFLPVDFKTTADVLNALDNLNYTGGGTSASSALTAVREGLIPLTQRVLGKKRQKSIIFILTDGKANMGGNPQDEAEKLKEANVEIFCVGITGSVLQESLFNIASDPKDEHVFILQNYASLTWVIGEITHGTIDYSECGLGHERLVKRMQRGRIVGGSKAPEHWSWMAGIYTAPEGSLHLDSAELQLQCGGTIIHQKYILTAAHCLYTREWILRDARDIVVRLGLMDLDNQTNLQEYEITKFFKPQEYKPGPNYDYDIAILVLKGVIEFTAFVRPVCLPPVELPPDTTLYKPNAIAVATGWGHEGVIPKHRVQNIETKIKNNLKEILMPIQSRSNCMKSARENNVIFTDRMLCAGDGRGGNDTCRGDSGGPLMQSQKDADENIYWTQVGIVSWGLGCGNINTYGFYTHLQVMMPWITSTIKLDA